MIFRKAIISDIEELVRLRMLFLNEVNSQIPKPDGFEADMEYYFRQNIAADSYVAWLAEENGTIAATSGLCFYQYAPNYSNPTGRGAYIQNMFTLPQYRGRGLASELFGRVVEEARTRGYRMLALHATDAGRKVYEKFGFTGTDDEMVKMLK